MGVRDERQGLVEGVAVTPHLGPGESVGDTGGAGGLTITEQLLLSLRLSGWPSALSPTLSSGCRSPDMGRRSQKSVQPPPLSLFTSLILYQPPP